VFLAALSILVLQIGLTRLLSVLLWYHFAFVAISLAMLGLALAGLLLYASPRLLAATPRALPGYCMLAALTTVLALVYALRAPLPAGAGMLSAEVVVLYLVLLAPFLSGGLAVSALLSFWSQRIDALYLFDLTGAALGCVLAVPLLDLAGAPTAILAAALLFAVAGAMLRPPPAGRRRRAADAAVVAVALAILLVQLLAAPFEPTHMHGIPDDAGRKVLDRWNSHSRIVVTETSPASYQINIDGSATTGIYRFDRLATTAAVRAQLPWLPLRGGSTPYELLPPPAEALVIGPGGGLDLLTGIHYGARITGIELNGIIHELMSSGPIAQWAGDVYRAPGVSVIHDEARSWIRRTDRRFDLIQASMIDTWAATATGAFALAENSLYTLEAFADFFAHLTEQGIVHFTRWHEDPPRQSLRIVVLMAEVMRRQGIADPAAHIVVLLEPMRGHEGTPMASLLWRRRPFAAGDLQQIEQLVQRRRDIVAADVLCWPGRELDNPISRYLHAADRGAFLREYRYDVTPTTDDRPFFFNTVRLSDAASIGRLQVENEQAVVVLASVLATVAAIVALAFAVPFLLSLRRMRRPGGGGVAVRMLYFACLGVGFMLLEIPVLQRFGLYVGHPAHTLSAVLASLLLGAGLGSWVSGRLWAASPLRGLRVVLPAILLAVAALALVVPPVLEQTLRFPLGLRIAVTVALLTPAGALLGCPLPLGVRALGEAGAHLVPWAWGLNGATSVLASVLAVAIGMYAGFTAALLAGGGCYLLAMAIAGWLPPRAGLPASATADAAEPAVPASP
jgi:spermidine synthase